ncbi:MAG: excalibur calcium-binding domain-containing protein [Thainema sp.]
MLRRFIGFVMGIAIAMTALTLYSPLGLAQTSHQTNCDPSYPDVCIAPPPPDLDCGEIEYRNFRVTGADPHRFDGDHDGIGCES